jgi:hypothetical protein
MRKAKEGQAKEGRTTPRNESGHGGPVNMTEMQNHAIEMHETMTATEETKPVIKIRTKKTKLTVKKNVAAALASLDVGTELTTEAASEVSSENTAGEILEAVGLEVHDTEANAAADEMMAAADIVLAEMEANPPLVAAAKPAKTTPTVMVTLPFKGQSVAFLEVMIGEKQSWLAKSSLTGFEIEDELVAIELPRTLARRRGLLAA